MTLQPTDQGDSALILRAAKLMKERAEFATASPWHARPVWSTDAVSTSAVYSYAHPTGTVESEVIASGRIRSGYGGSRNPNDVVHIAGMQPSVALLLAAWLESCGEALAATSVDFIAGCDEPDAVRTALGIAEAYLKDGA